MAAIDKFLGVNQPKKGPTRAKARKILSDGKVRGKKLSKKQRGFFGARAGAGAGSGEGRIQKARIQKARNNPRHK